MATSALALAGCGSSTEPTAPLVTTLSSADVQAVAGQIASPAASTVGGLNLDLTSASIGGVAGVSASVLGSSTAVTAQAATYPVSRSTDCPAGGTASTTGSITGALAGGGSGSLSAALVTTYAACGIVADSKTLLITGDPSLNTVGSYVVVGRVPAAQQTIRVTGAVRIAVSGSRAPALPCAVDLTVVVTGSSRSGSVIGSVCGATVSKDFTYTP